MRYGRQAATAVKISLVGLEVKMGTKCPVLRANSKMVNEPSLNPKTTRWIAKSDPALSLLVSTAMAVGTTSGRRSSCMLPSSFRSFLEDHALSPDMESAVYTIPSCKHTNSGGIGGWSATWISVMAQVPLAQLCILLYSNFQLVSFSDLARVSSSGHLESLDENGKCAEDGSMPGNRATLGRTNRL